MSKKRKRPKRPGMGKLTGATARCILLRMVAAYPGFVTDEEVPGADLVEWMSNEVFALLPDAELKDRAKNGTPDDEDLDAEDSERARFIKRARENYQREGETEIDDNAELSRGDDGAYVQAWVWVADSDLE